jgi:hypothetical protein
MPICGIAILEKFDDDLKFANKMSLISCSFLESLFILREPPNFQLKKTPEPYFERCVTVHFMAQPNLLFSPATTRLLFPPEIKTYSIFDFE